jgi:hypothetical protein
VICDGLLFVLVFQDHLFVCEDNLFVCEELCPVFVCEEQ